MHESRHFFQARRAFFGGNARPLWVCGARGGQGGVSFSNRRLGGVTDDFVLIGWVERGNPVAGGDRLIIDDECIPLPEVASQVLNCRGHLLALTRDGKICRRLVSKPSWLR